MQRMFTALFLVLVALGFPAHASAQSPADLKKSLALLQAQVDQLQRALNTQLGDPLMATYLDGSHITVDPVIGTTALVYGWGFRCGGPEREPLATVAIDGILADNLSLARYSRPDVTAVYFLPCQPYGGLIPEVGATFIVDLSNYAPGPHTIQLRLRDYRGAAVQSNTITVVRP